MKREDPTRDVATSNVLVPHPQGQGQGQGACVVDTLRICVALLPQLSLRPNSFLPSFLSSFLPSFPCLHFHSLPFPFLSLSSPAARPLYGRVTSNLRVAHFSPRRTEAAPRAKGARACKKGGRERASERALTSTLPRTSARNVGERSEGPGRAAQRRAAKVSFLRMHFPFYLSRPCLGAHRVRTDVGKILSIV